MMVTAGGVTRTHVYTYDNIYQITNVDYPPELSYLATDTEFHYDAAGNRTSVIDGSGTCTYTTNSLNQYTAAGTVDFEYDASGNMTYDEQFLYSYDPENRLVQVKKSGQGPQALSNATDTTLVFTTGGSAPWFGETGYAYYDNDAAQSGDIGDGQQSWLQTTVEGPGMISFYWAVSSDGGDYLQFYLDDDLQDDIAGVSGFGNRWYNITGSGEHTLKWVYVKNGTGSYGSDCGWVDKVLWQPAPTPPDSLAEAVDSPLAFTTGGDDDWAPYVGGYYGNDSARSPELAQGQESWMQTTVEGEGTFSFWAMLTPEDSQNELEFYIDGTLRYSCTVSDWEQKSYTITGTGTHTLKWVYTQYAEDSGGAGYVDYVQWDGYVPQPPPQSEPDPEDWKILTYVYDAAGRRIEKKYDGDTIVQYVYDGDHCLAEYNGYGQLLRKYIYGPGVDQPICMIEAGEGNAPYYYHFDGLGSVVALTNASGNTVEVYEYDVYGRVGASDASHPNRIMFTGREYDKETGLYYYRARYYNPQIGRFLQTDPIGYEDGMNPYRYCRNNPIAATDPSGHIVIASPQVKLGAGDAAKVTGAALILHYLFGKGHPLEYGAAAWDDLFLGSEVEGQMYTPLFMIANQIGAAILGGSKKGTIWDYFGVEFDPTKGVREWLLHGGTMNVHGSWQVDSETKEDVKFTMSVTFTYIDQGDWNFNYTFDQVASLYEACLNTFTIYGWLVGTNPYLITVTSSTKTIQCSLKKSTGVVRIEWPAKKETPTPSEGNSPPSDAAKNMEPKG
jgi:RHS repeat-associated protein